jgi:deoxyribodipyrimidine photo-lyase
MPGSRFARSVRAVVDLVWFRRDLRLSDNAAVAGASSPAVGLFVVEDSLWRPAGPRRRAYLAASLRELDAGIRRTGGAGLVVRMGRSADQVPRVAADVGATRVLAAADFSPFGVARDAAVAVALAPVGVALDMRDSPYLHAPGVVRRDNGAPYSVFTPYFRAWSELPVHEPFATASLRWSGAPGEPLPPTDLSPGVAGEHAAVERARRFAAERADRYPVDRNRPDRAGTSLLGPALHFGEIHPRTILAGRPPGPEFVRQLAWRDFYADVLYRLPQAAWTSVDRRFDHVDWRDGADAGELLRVWTSGQTGYPFVDAGMRQLDRDGWMHNRVRMVVASFLTKDLLIEWQHGASWFLQHLTDADIASNSLGWQWAAGTGMDAAPFHRVFNPVLQGRRFDPEGDYVRRFVPELAHLPGVAVHEPWSHPDGYLHGYPQRVVDHAAARRTALAEYASVRVR